MRLGIWTPLPHTIRSEPAMEGGVRQVKTRGGGGTPDKSFQFALDVVSRGEALGFDITLIAERLLGPDLEAWMLTAALASRTKTIQIMPAAYPIVFVIVIDPVGAGFVASLARPGGNATVVGLGHSCDIVSACPV